ncbi:SNF2-related protein [Bradyrhizobium sp. 191]|uniref:SNF2-related protein n=1 Tax=Bradyrhizobium sp. 191 TaxID=2782659 RepID=UPI001FFF68C8|nr:SNF2-related protein [Bradyrhizobium sp. 191]
MVTGTGVVDEAQRVKNWNTVAARALKRIDSPYAIVLTGTPLENKLEELVSIVQFVDQHRLGPTWKLLNEHQVRMRPVVSPAIVISAGSARPSHPS